MKTKSTWGSAVIGFALAALGYFTTDWMLGPSKPAPAPEPAAEAVGSADGHAVQQVLKAQMSDLTATAVAQNNSSRYDVGDSLGASKAKKEFDPAYPEFNWEGLIPKDWDPMAAFKGMNMAKLKDSDPQAVEALNKMKEAWNDAPVEIGVNGKKVRIAGFAVPLEQAGQSTSELLLVPYFGACIHTPPPPANQIIHVKLKNKVPAIGAMQPYWVWGELKVARNSSSMGDSGYRLDAVGMQPYEQ